MAKSKSKTIPSLYTGCLIWEGRDVNPNGDPDNAGAPRTDPFTGHGLMSPQCVTRRVRDRVLHRYENKAPYSIQIQRGVTIEDAILDGANAAGIAPSKKLKPDERKSVTQSVCDLYFDTRMFGGVLNIGSCPTDGVNGVVTMMWGRSVEPVVLQEQALTRVNAANSTQEKTQEMGRSTVVAHGVYEQNFFINPHHAKKNGGTNEDLAIFLDSLINAFEHKRSVMGGMLSLRGLWLFRHDSPYGNAPAHLLLDRVNVETDKGELARSWKDYSLTFDDAKMPKGITTFNLEQLLGGPEAIEKVLAE